MATCAYALPDGSMDHPHVPTINQAVLSLSELPAGWAWYGWTSECFECEMLPPLPVAKGNASCSLVSATFPFTIEARSSSNGQVVQSTLNLEQRGGYAVSLAAGASAIQLETTYKPVAMSEIWGPLVTLFAVVMALFGLRWVVSARAQPSEKEATEPRAAPDGYVVLEPKDEASQLAAPRTATAPVLKTQGGSTRLNSLDTFRGLSLTFMIFVNYGGGGYWWLDHSSWDGLTVADLLFPWFMWMQGVSMAIALKGRRHAKQSRSAMLTQIARRSATLCAIGLFLDCPGTLGTWRFPGVLQYFAFSYAWVSLAMVLTGSWDGAPGAAAEEAAARASPQGTHDQDSANAPVDPWRDLRYFWREWPVVLATPLLWLVLTFAVDVPGCGRGYLGPGGLSEVGMEKCTGGSHRYIDLAVFGRNHIYGDPTCVDAYQCKTPYDPEGLVGAFNAVFLTYLGLLAGRVMVYHTTPRARLTRLVTMGAIALALGGILCGFKQHGGAIPVNKNLWSTSFVLVCGGGGYWMLALLYLLVDVWGAWGGAPFRYTGMNSIVVYAGSEILESYLPFYFASSPRTHWGHLASNVVGAASWNAIATHLYHRKTFIKI